jgi:hypothetical protein
MKLLEQVAQLTRTKHFSLRAEKAYIYWIARFIRPSRLRRTRPTALARLSDGRPDDILMFM